ncbi:hypothetical protein DYB35_010695 [Aphanomyces astaci]|uniref:Uncharacterized protein n=1 Tax=Aphanomyces astaci TaxID=112090 RepID=A0A3R6WIB9_APHAT|nr:hypothetical protein DYB35_010695 [Aphanomyces astaci]
MAIVKIVNVATVKPVRRAAFESDSESDDETDRLTKKPKKSPGTKDDVDVSRVPGDDYFAAWNASDVQLVSGDDVAASLAPLSLPHHVIAPHVTFKNVDNIRRRHASGTFTKLVLPAMTWIDVVSKHATTFPWIRGIQGDLRMRKIMEVLPTDPVSIRLHVVLPIVDKTLARRQYFRERQRKCRLKLNADVVAVTEEFVHLQSVLDGLQAIRPPSMVEERTNNTRLFHTKTPDGAFVNSLQGHFHEADRFIVVVRQVEHDEVHMCDPLLRQRHYRLW